MHVVLIYQCLAFMASLFRLRQHGIVFNLTILLLIWFYIFITGLQASASRAAIMITLVLLSKIVQRDNQNTNSLFATAFLMLLYNPYYLADAGFILSFLAVAGILISSSLVIQESNNKIVAYFFNASLISMAAQTATFPYSVHLFHQFPVYFLLANLIVVPLTTLLLFLAIVLLLAYDVPYLNELLVLLIERFTDGLFYILQCISYLPYPTISHISLSTVELLFLYAALLMAILLFIQRQVKWLWGITLSLTLLSCSLQYRMIKGFQQPAILVSGKKDHRQYLFSCGHEAWVLQYKKDTALQRAADLFMTEHFVKDYQTITIQPQCSFILQQGTKSYGVLLKKSVKIQPTDDFFENCDTLLLDYTIKYSYLDPNNKSIPNKKIFPLYGKKSFYSMTSSYELDTD
jgi:competence protein ComEC